MPLTRVLSLIKISNVILDEFHHWKRRLVSLLLILDSKCMYTIRIVNVCAKVDIQKKGVCYS